MQNEIGIVTRIVDVDEIDNIDQILLEKYDLEANASPEKVQEFLRNI